MALVDVQNAIDQFKETLTCGPSTQTSQFARPGGWLWNRHPAAYGDLKSELEDLIDALKNDVTNAY